VNVEWPEGIELAGTEQANIDDKGRLLFSKKKRDILGKEFVFRLGSKPYLEVLPKSIWDQMKEEARQQFTSGTGAKDHLRFFFANADVGQNFDGQGRVVVPARLRKAAGLNKDVFIIGCGLYAEIWDVETYEKYLDDPESVDLKREKAMERAEDKLGGKWQQPASS
jgi:MraZ protein